MANVVVNLFGFFKFAGSLLQNFDFLGNLDSLCYVFSIFIEDKFSSYFYAV
jgi:hypothetical protein